MFSRIFSTAKRILSATPDAEQEEPSQVQLKDTEQMVATRQRGELPPIQDTPMKKKGSPANAKIVRKRKTYEIPVAEVAAESENEAPREEPSSAKRRKVVNAREKSVDPIVETRVEVAGSEEEAPEELPSLMKSNTAREGKKELEKDLQIRTKTTIAVVLPAMAPIPPSELSYSENVSEENVDTTVAEIEAELRSEAKRDEEAKIEAEIEGTAEETPEDLAVEEHVEVPGGTSIPSLSEKLMLREEIIKQKPSSRNKRQRYAVHTDFSSDRITPFQNQPLLLGGFLPTEFLEDNNEKDKPRTLDLVRPLPRSKRRKFTDLVKIPQDRRVGNTTYKIAKTQNSNMAPKSSTTAPSAKEAWLDGRNKLRLKQGNMRKPFSKGLFVKKK